MIELKDITFSYLKGTPALSGASAKIGAGVNLLLGPNGAGKTTLMKLMAGMLMPEQGECVIDGVDVSHRSVETLSRIFFVSDDCLYPLDSIAEMARRHAVFYETFSPERLRENLGAFGMTGEEKLSAMSLGNRKKAQVAYALALGTEILLLDEPANGMDLGSKKTLNTLISQNVSDGQTVIISTHTVHEMRNLFDGVIFIDRGTITMSESAAEIERRWAFVTTPRPVVGALYYEPSVNGFRNIILNTDGIESDIDYEMLYCMLAGRKNQ